MSVTTNKTTVQFAEDHDRAAIERFNRRLEAGGRREKLTLRFNVNGEATNRPQGFPVNRKLMIAKDSEEVRAGMLLCHRTIFVRGDERDFCWIEMPLSEGIIDKKYSLAIVQLVKTALAYQPFLLNLGVGSLTEDWSRFMLKMGWKHAAVPFLFCPVKVTKVLRSLKYLKNSTKLRLASSVAAYSGAGAVLGGFLALRRQLVPGIPSHHIVEEPTFDTWATEVFTNSVDDYGAVMRRDATTLNKLYPSHDSRFTRLRVLHKETSQELGWIVVIKKRMHNDKYFGDLQVGTLVDGFGQLANVPALIAAGLRHLVRAGVDLVVANWSHDSWLQSSRRLGFLPGPTNYFFYTTPAGTPLLQPSCPRDVIHLTRGDCDGLGALL